METGRWVEQGDRGLRGGDGSRCSSPITVSMLCVGAAVVVAVKSSSKATSAAIQGALQECKGRCHFSERPPACTSNQPASNQAPSPSTSTPPLLQLRSTPLYAPVNCCKTARVVDGVLQLLAGSWTITLMMSSAPSPARHCLLALM